MNFPRSLHRAFSEPVPPPPLDSAGSLCFTIDGKWIPLVLGALLPLAIPETYASDGERAAGEASLLISQFMTDGQCAEGNLDCSAISFRIGLNGHLFFTCNGDEIDLGNVIGRRGAQGPPGQEGQSTTGDPGLDGVGMLTSPEDNIGGLEGVSCAIAWAVTERLHERWLDALDQIDLMVQLGDTLARITAKFVDLLAQFTVFGDEAVDSAAELVTGIVNYGVNVVRTEDTAEFQDQVRCALYSALLANGGTFSDDHNGTYEDWATSVAALSPFAIAISYGLFITCIANRTYQLWAKMAASDTADCSDCEDCGPIVIQYTSGWGPTRAQYGQRVTMFSTLTNGIQVIDFNISDHVKINLEATHGYLYGGGQGGVVIQTWDVNMTHRAWTSNDCTDLMCFPNGMTIRRAWLSDEKGLDPFSVDLRLVTEY